MRRGAATCLRPGNSTTLGSRISSLIIMASSLYPDRLDSGIRAYLFRQAARVVAVGNTLIDISLFRFSNSKQKNIIY